MERVSEEESNAYFNSRPRGSQIGAWTSNQSRAIVSRRELEEQEERMKANFDKVERIPRPAHCKYFRIFFLFHFMQKFIGFTSIVYCLRL